MMGMGEVGGKGKKGGKGMRKSRDKQPKPFDRLDWMKAEQYGQQRFSFMMMTPGELHERCVTMSSIPSVARLPENAQDHAEKSSDRPT